ncbi:hypothetical protein G7K_5227-t1 [Saitoella complicata NRRL Y-17804]|uniref:Uncharacterized protein n=1 Tax=Saitoella complicata (strain BCRC 22490 / CBS 7301 / JCM 7358 / NBRC 10748 / NRRL Y-17804) TaxID=698492 RepID=A0A0E9NN57_SAICN|nr:hypothetical protein G7K_5227-t1 [Saitoella complicata NRRL Y-17804]
MSLGYFSSRAIFQKLRASPTVDSRRLPDRGSRQRHPTRMHMRGKSMEEVIHQLRRSLKPFVCPGGWEDVQ